MKNPNIPLDICELSRSKALSFYKLSRSHFPDEIEPGQIWSTHSLFKLPDGQRFTTDEPKLVIILLGSGKRFKKLETITVAPISIHTSMASEYDFIVNYKKGYSPLSFDFMVEVWNETPALKGQLNKYICSLSEEATKALHLLYSNWLSNEEISNSLKEYIGMRIIAEDDPRRIFQEEEIATVSYIAKAATASLVLEIEEQEVTETVYDNWNVFDIQPFWGKLSGFLRGPAVAHAANNINTEVESCLIMQLEKNEKFIFELLSSRRQPYLIYLKAYSISSDFIGRNCIISVKTRNEVFQSNPEILDEGITIEVGNNANFRCEDVETVQVAIEPR